ncbi:MAG: helix-turn-helix domain-containing protein [Methanoregula sp.]|jgi:excisionase family DNA binding protein|nr:helix-turn-helix domain-containing protein [Methanoregula sp.]
MADSKEKIELLTTAELAEFLRISMPSVYRLVEQRIIPFYKIKGVIRFAKGEVLEYLQHNRIESANKL